MNNDNRIDKLISHIKEIERLMSCEEKGYCISESYYDELTADDIISMLEEYYNDYRTDREKPITTGAYV